MAPGSGNLSRRGLIFATGGFVAARAVAQGETRTPVSLVHGEDRRKNVYDALVAVDDRILPALKRKKYVIIKPNVVSVSNQLASTHADALRGILDYLAPRHKGPVIVADSSRDETYQGFETFHYDRVCSEHRSQHVSLIDLNEDGRYQLFELIDSNLHMMQVRLAALLLDPDAFVISSALLKAHDNVVATLSLKNLALGAPLHSPRNAAQRWHDKTRYHAGFRQMHMNIFLTAKRMQPFWGAAVIDGYEGLEGNGPLNGTPVPSRVAIASADPVAADRVGAEVMGVDPDWLGYLNYCSRAGLGQFDLAKIEVRGVDPATVRRTYKLHAAVGRQLQWMGPIANPGPPRS